MNKKIKDEIVSDIIVGIVAIVIVIILNNFVFMPARVTGTSMCHTLEEDELCFSFYYDKDNIDRFDIVVIQTDESKKLIKRVIGLPNEKIEYKDNKLYIDGKYVKEDFLEDDTITNDFVYKLRDNEYFCLGDNREVSKDSRIYGPFMKDSIIASHIFIYYPINKMRFID